MPPAARAVRFGYYPGERGVGVGPGMVGLIGRRGVAAEKATGPLWSVDRTFTIFKHPVRFQLSLTAPP